MQEINLRVTIEEANLILEALGNLPFVKVFGLIAKVQEQARDQLGTQAPAQPPDQTSLPGITVDE